MGEACKDASRVNFDSRAPGLAACAILVAICLNVQPSFSAAKPNVVLFLVDDMGYTDSSTYGSGYYETPSIDRLASQGMRFTNMYSASPVCSPTRASILTGMTPARLRLTDWISGHGDAGKPLSEPAWTKQLRQDRFTLAEALNARGYATAHIGKWHLGQSGRSEAKPTTQGFDVNVGGNHRGLPNGSTGGYFANSSGSFGLPGLGHGSSAPGEYLTDRLTHAATEYVTQQATLGQPFFLQFSHYAVHTPLAGKPELVQKYRDKPPVGGHHNATYAAMLESMDQSLGAVLDVLEDPNGDNNTSDSIADDTVILFTSDNGGLGTVTSNAPLRAGKGTNYEGGIRVPFVVKWQDHTAGGSITDEPAAAWDVYATVLDIAGLDARSHAAADSVSLVPVLEGSGSRGGELYFHYPHYHTRVAKPHSAIRQGDWKLILNYENATVELYDLAGDVGETTNLAVSKPAKVAELRAKLDQYLISIDAQLPTGTPVTLPDKNRDGAGVISINLGTGSGTTMDPQEFAGVVEENHWNNAISAGRQAGAGSIADLVDGNGNPTGASFAFQAGYMNYNGNLGTADYRMMEGWGGNHEGDTANSFSVANLPIEFTEIGLIGYDLYVYFDSNDDGDTRQMSFRIGDDTLYGTELSTNFDGFFIEAAQSGVTGFGNAHEGNYVVFRDLHMPSFDLAVDAADGRRGTVNGMQIIQVRKPILLEGDIDGDGEVDFADFSILAGNFTGRLDPGTGGKTRDDGDFDADGDVDFGDFSALAGNFAGTITVPASNLPAEEGDVHLQIDLTNDGAMTLQPNNANLAGYSIRSPDSKIAPDADGAAAPFLFYLLNAPQEVTAGSVGTTTMLTEALALDIRFEGDADQATDVVFQYTRAGEVTPVDGTVHVIPEPAAMILLAAGGLLVLPRHRRCA